MLSPFVFQLMLLLLGACGLEGRAGLRLLTNSSCICPGQQIVFECVTVGPAIQFTVWRGSALDCSNGISLRHGLFRDTGYASASCNNGAVMARIVSSVNNYTISQLTIRSTSLNFNGKSIQCSFDNGSIETFVGRESIDLMAAYPPPTNVRLVDVQPGQITFSWTPVDTLCQLLSYRIISSNCGSCPDSTSHSNTTCSDIPLTSEHACFFRLQTISCGSNAGNLSDITSVILRVPKISAVISIPFYDHETRRLQRIVSSFDALEQDSEFLVSNFSDLKAHVTSYSITYSDVITGNICSEDTDIPAGSCHGGICRHIFEVSSSFCHPSTNITITVRALTLLGAGPPSDPITIDVRNNVFDVSAVFDSKQLVVTCTLLNLVPSADSERLCTISFGLQQGGTCNNLSHSITTRDTTHAASKLQVSVDLPLLLMKPMSDAMCFVTTISVGTYNAETGLKLTVNAAAETYSGCRNEYIGFSMGMVILAILCVSLIIAATTLFIKSKQKILRLKTSNLKVRGTESTEIYEDIDLSQVIDSKTNIAYVSRSP